MSVAVSFEPGAPAFVAVTAAGPLSPADVNALWSQTVAACAAQDCWRVLFDARDVTQGPDQVFLFHLGEQTELLPHSLQMAVLEPTDSAGRRMAAFWETTATNRGMLARRFAAEEDAVAWLAG